MKSIQGRASAVVAAAREECLALLAAVEKYPRWYPDVVRDVRLESSAHDDAPERAEVTLHVARGPLVRDFKLLMEVSVVQAASVTLTRIPHDGSDREQFEVAWVLEEEVGGTRIDLRIDANLDVPRLVPLGGIGDDLAAGFLRAACEALPGPS